MYTVRIIKSYALEPLLSGLCINMMHAVASLKMYIVRIIAERYFAFGENILTLHLTSELVELRVGYAKRIQELRS